MLFNTISYLIFLPICIGIIFIVPKKLKNLLLLVISYLFFIEFGNPLYVLFLIFGTIITYVAANLLVKTDRKKPILVSTISLQVFLLGFFKYGTYLLPDMAKFFKEIGFLYVNDHSGILSIAVPVGISYYTFATIGYLVDVYRGKVTNEKNFIKLAVFVSFFPQVLSGPIPRADKLLPQLDGNYTFNYARSTDALRIMLFGFFKKIAIADMLAMYINTVYADYLSYTGLSFIFVVILYSIWLYCDFSGYCDIALATGKLLGIDVIQNFRTPLFSSSIKEFWQRWHISLSTWLKDYIYIPLGGSRNGKPRFLFNLGITFVISGVWHGAGLLFFIWGLLHALYQIIEALLPVPTKTSIPKTIFKTCTVYYLVSVAFLFFRSTSMDQALHMLVGQFQNISITNFISETTAAIAQGFNANHIFILGYMLFCVLVVAIQTTFDALSYYKFKDIGFAGIVVKLSTLPRHLIYYMLLAFILAAFIMQNGNYVGNVSTAYANF